MEEMNSILTSTKKQLGIVPECEDFDADIIIHINSVFMILAQLGVGPSAGFAITDKSAEWTDFIPESATACLAAVKSYMAKKVGLMFDPPSNSIIMEANNRIIAELEVRLRDAAESIDFDGEEY